MILDAKEENLDLLAITACPADFYENCSNESCLLQDDEMFEKYNGSYIDICRACWLKWLSKESEDNHE